MNHQPGTVRAVASVVPALLRALVWLLRWPLWRFPGPGAVLVWVGAFRLSPWLLRGRAGGLVRLARPAPFPSPYGGG